MKIALVHDWLKDLGGAERVLIELHKIFPNAPIYTLFVTDKFRKNFLADATIHTSSLQNFPLISKIYKYLFFLMPSAVESFDLSEFDTVISSSVSFSKGIVLKPKTKHICFCYSPTRFLWDRNASYEHSGILSRIGRHFLRIWDRQTGDRVDDFVAISENVRARIQKYYRKDAQVIYPPITLTTESDFKPKEENYYLIVSRLHDFKNIHLAIDVFNKLGLPLVIIGDGPAKGHLKKIAGKNIKLLGYKSDAVIAGYYNHCRAFIMPQEEDFGLTPIEAMSFGKPVLALKRGGAIETISEGITGEFFDDPISEALADGIRRLNDNYKKYDSELIKKTAEKFSREKFKEQILKTLD